MYPGMDRYIYHASCDVYDLNFSPSTQVLHQIRDPRWSVEGIRGNHNRELGIIEADPVETDKDRQPDVVRFLL